MADSEEESKVWNGPIKADSSPEDSSDSEDEGGGSKMATPSDNVANASAGASENSIDPRRNPQEQKAALEKEEASARQAAIKKQEEEQLKRERAEREKAENAWAESLIDRNKQNPELRTNQQQELPMVNQKRAFEAFMEERKKRRLLQRELDELKKHFRAKSQSQDAHYSKDGVYRPPSISMEEPLKIASWHPLNEKNRMGQGTYGTVYATSIKKIVKGTTPIIEYDDPNDPNVVPIAVKVEIMGVKQKSIEIRRSAAKKQFDNAMQALKNCSPNVLPIVQISRFREKILPSMIIRPFEYEDGRKTTQAVTIMGHCTSLIEYAQRCLTDATQRRVHPHLYHGNYLKRMLEVFDICRQIRKENYFHEDLKCGNLGVLSETNELVFLDLDSLKPMRLLAPAIYATYSSVRTNQFKDYARARTTALKKGTYDDRTLLGQQRINRIVAAEVSELIAWSGQIATLIQFLFLAQVGPNVLFYTYCESKRKDQSKETRFFHANAKADPDFLLNAAEALIQHINAHINFRPRPREPNLKADVVTTLREIIRRIKVLTNAIGTDMDHLYFEHEKQGTGGGGPA
jgi:hypothetical protein